MIKKTVFCFFFLLTCSAIAQKSDNTQNIIYYRKNPIWIKMMNDSNVNFYQAINAFNEFWKCRAIPDLENDEKEIIEKQSDSLNSETNNPVESQQYAAEYKNFLDWIQVNSAFIKEDGTLYTANERIIIWKYEMNARENSVK